MAIRFTRNYYEILGIARNATDDEIRRAFRKLAFKYHPDRNHEDGAEEKFKEINEAYQVLSDHGKRTAYDELQSSYARTQATYRPYRPTPSAEVELTRIIMQKGSPVAIVLALGLFCLGAYLKAKES